MRSIDDSCSLNPVLKTAMSWNPKSACIPGTTVRHSSSTCEAASWLCVLYWFSSYCSIPGGSEAI